MSKIEDPAPTSSSPLEAESFRFQLPGRLEYREALLQFMVFLCHELEQQKNISPDFTHRLISSFMEAYNNAVVHASGTGPLAVTIELDVGLDKIRLQVTNTGPPVIAPKPTSADLDTLPEHGMGLFIIKSFMDSVRYDRIGHQNVIIMEKRFPNPSVETGKIGSK